jgi:hypothetical protein
MAETGREEFPQGLNRLRKKAEKPRKKQIPHPVQKPNGVRNDMDHEFFTHIFALRHDEMTSWPLGSQNCRVAASCEKETLRQLGRGTCVSAG